MSTWVLANPVITDRFYISLLGPPSSAHGRMLPDNTVLALGSLKCMVMFLSNSGRILPMESGLMSVSGRSHAGCNGGAMVIPFLEAC